MSLLAVLIACIQDPVTIPMGHKGVYKKAADDCKEAARVLDSDPKKAFELLDAILNDAKIEKRECRLRIEIRRNEYTDWYDFHPHHFRGRACLLLSEKEEDHEKAAQWAERAIADLKASVGLGLAASSAPLKKAEARLDALKTARTDVEPEFRRAWQVLIDSGRFAAARDHVRAKGQALPESKRKRYESDTERLCREHVTAATEEFLRSLERVGGRDDLAEMRRDKFETAFALPDPADLVASAPALDWCRSMRDTLRLFRDGKDVLASLLDHAVHAAPLAPEAWLAAAERLAHEEAHDRISTRATRAKDAAAAERRELRKEAEWVRQQWQAFEARVKRTGRRLPARDFGPLLGGFPIEEDPTASLESKLQAALVAEIPEKALAKFAQDLNAAQSEDRWVRRVVEARRIVVRYQIIVGTLQGWLSGKTTDDIVPDLRKLGRDLKDLGGTLEENDLGAKVRELFERLR